MLRRGTRVHDGALSSKAQRVRVLLQDCPRGGRKAAQGEVDRDVAGGVGRHSHVHPLASLRGTVHNIVGHACHARRGARGLVMPRRCGVRPFSVV